MTYKARILPRGAGNVRANMYLYKAIGKAASADTTVVLHDEGDEGRYNRANRSLHHFTESAATTVGAVCLAGFVYPFAAFVAAVVLAGGALVHQVGYAEGGYGKHGRGFLMRLATGLVLEGMLLTAALQASGVL